MRLLDVMHVCKQKRIFSAPSLNIVITPGGYLEVKLLGTTSQNTKIFI